jgi:hypothetical protein
VGEQDASVPLGCVRAGEELDASYFGLVVGVMAGGLVRWWSTWRAVERLRQRMMSSLDRPWLVRRST